MTSCNLCPNSSKLYDVDQFVGHLKQRHSYKQTGDFVCPKCKNSWHRMNKYHKHLKICIPKNDIQNTSFKPNPHSVINDCNLRLEYVPQLHPILENSLETQTRLHENVDTEMESTYIENENEYFNTAKNAQEYALRFALKLHSKANFTRSDVFFIQTLVIQLLMNILAIIEQELSKSPAVEELKAVINIVIKSFKNIGTEHLLTKNLVDRNLATNLENKNSEFVINKEVGVVFKDRVSSFGNLTTTGMLMPLFFQIKE